LGKTEFFSRFSTKRRTVFEFWLRIAFFDNEILGQVNFCGRISHRDSRFENSYFYLNPVKPSRINSNAAKNENMSNKIALELADLIIFYHNDFKCFQKGFVFSTKKDAIFNGHFRLPASIIFYSSYSDHHLSNQHKKGWVQVLWVQMILRDRIKNENKVIFKSDKRD